MKNLLIFIALIFTSNCFVAQIDSTFFHYGNGDTAKYYILDDGFVFKFQNNVVFDDATIINSPIVKDFKQIDLNKNLNLLKFSDSSSFAERENIRNQIKANSNYLVDFPYLINQNETIISDYSKTTCDNLLLIVFKDTFITVLQVNDFAIRNSLTLAHAPSNLLPPALWTYTFNINLDTCLIKNPLQVAREIFENESNIVKIVAPNLYSLGGILGGGFPNVLSEIKEIKPTIYENSIFPNPSNGILTITLKENIETELSITNNYGKKIESLNLISNWSKIDFNHLKSGVYFFTLKNKNGLNEKKRIVIL